MSKRKTQEEFVSEVKAIHGDNVEVLGQYITIETPILIRYKDCEHEEMKKPVKLLAGHGCNICRFKRLSATKTKTTEQYCEDLLNKGIDYIKVLSEYKGVSQQIKVLNTKCGHTYSANAGNILNLKSGCPICHGDKDNVLFRELIESKYPGEYTFIEEYVNGLTPILIRHNECGREFKCIPKTLLKCPKCPRCITSQGEIFIAKYLEQNNIPYEQQAIMDGCKDVLGLPFDFKIIINGIIKLIEFDGIQHFPEGRTKYRTSKVFEHDQIKNEYCNANNIPLLRIPYWYLRSKKITNALDAFIRE